MALKPPILCYSTFVFLPSATGLNDNKIKFKLNGNTKASIYYKIWTDDNAPNSWTQVGAANIDEDSYNIASFNGASLCTNLDKIYKFKLAAKETASGEDKYYESDTILIQKSSSISISYISASRMVDGPRLFKISINRNSASTDNIAQYKLQLIKNNSIYIDSGNILNNKYDQIFWEVYPYLQSGDYTLKFHGVTNYGKIINEDLSTVIAGEIDDSSTGSFTVTADLEKGTNNISITGLSDPTPIYRAKKDSGVYSLIGKITDNFIDRTIEDSAAYDYVINNAKVSSPKNTFENDYLTDENHQLIIKFNKNLSNYKQTFLSSSQTTIGSQYPIVRRAGKNNYKTFQIGGLISYQMESFETDVSITDSVGTHQSGDEKVERTPRFHNGDNNYNDWFSVVYDNNFGNEEDETKKERLFRDKVIEFLSSDTIKLFRSATEGNIFVSLKDISLTPENGTGRTIYTFAANATEVAPVNDKYLRQFKLIK